MRITETSIKSLCVAKMFKENQEHISSLDFNSTGELLISSSDDDSITLYDCQAGTAKRNLYSKKYGVDHIRFTHHDNAAIHTSTKVDGLFCFVLFIGQISLSIYLSRSFPSLALSSHIPGNIPTDGRVGR